MSPYFCPKCGTELVAGMNFCRLCGEPVAVTSDASERPTSILNQPPVGVSAVGGQVTDRLDPRPTGEPGVAPSPYNGSAIPAFSASKVPEVPRRSGPMRGLLIVAVIVLVLFGLGSVVGVMRSAIMSRIHWQAAASQPVNQALVYPGAQTLLNVGSGGGSGVLQLKTTDPIDKVAAWYDATLKPTKTIRVASTVIMKTDKISATLVSEGDQTNIIIKHAP